MLLSHSVHWIWTSSQFSARMFWLNSLTSHMPLIQARALDSLLRGCSGAVSPDFSLARDALLMFAILVQLSSFHAKHPLLLLGVPHFCFQILCDLQLLPSLKLWHYGNFLHMMCGHLVAVPQPPGGQHDDHPRSSVLMFSVNSLSACIYTKLVKAST